MATDRANMSDEPVDPQSQAQERLRRLAEMGTPEVKPEPRPARRARTTMVAPVNQTMVVGLATESAAALPSAPRGPAVTAIKSAPDAPSRDYEDLKHQLHARLVEQLQPEKINNIPESRRRPELRKIVE